MNKKEELFNSINEPYAAGLFEDEDRGDFYRFSKAIRRFYEARHINSYKGGRLYPSGLDERGEFTVQPDCAKTFNPAFGGKGTLRGFYDPLSEKSKEAAEIMFAFRQEHNFTVEPSSEAITISGYTHSIPYYERIIAEGFDSYIPRIQKIQDRDMKEGLLEVLQGLRIYHKKCLEELNRANADQELIAALNQVPFQPARNIYEAIVCWNFILYLDGTDNIGWIDHGLLPYYKGENVEPELREMFENIGINDGWSCSLGPEYTDLTRQCLRALKGLFRPMAELRVTPEMPDDMWELAIETVFSGGGQPAFYNEPVVQSMLKTAMPDVKEEDLIRFSGAGCTEPNLAGISNVGGIDANLNLALIFEKYMYEMLPKAGTFDAFYQGYCERVKEQAALMIKDVQRNHKNRARHLPNPMRSLLIDECIDKGLDYNNGGAKFNAALTAESGMINVIDSLEAIRELIYEQKRFSVDDFLERIKREDEELFANFRHCKKFGTDNEETNRLAKEFSEMYYSCFEGAKCYRGGIFLPSSHQFNRYGKEGKKVGPTPDGRKAGEPLCDSVAPIGGNATDGPTAALLSSSHLAQNKILGIPVYNLTLHKRYPKEVLKALIQGYFKSGGTQIQVTMISREELEDAMIHPEKHEDLVVRVGGYSEYFNRLTPELKEAVYKRTIFEITGQK